MLGRALLTLLLLNVAGTARAQDFEVFRASAGEVEHAVFGRGLVVLHVTRRADRVEACAYSVEGERLAGRTPGERCGAATPPRLEGWGSDAPRAFFGELELARVPSHEGLELTFPDHRGAWLALAEIGQALGRCTHPHRYLRRVDGEAVYDGRHVEVACRPGVHLRTSPRRLNVRAGNSYRDRTPRCAGFADARDFELVYVEEGGACFRDFTIDRHTPRRRIEEAFHGRCRADGEELVCDGFRILPGESVQRSAR